MALPIESKPSILNSHAVVDVYRMRPQPSLSDPYQGRAAQPSGSASSHEIRPQNACPINSFGGGVRRYSSKCARFCLHVSENAGNSWSRRGNSPVRAVEFHEVEMSM